MNRDDGRNEGLSNILALADFSEIEEISWIGRRLDGRFFFDVSHFNRKPHRRPCRYSEEIRPVTSTRHVGRLYSASSSTFPALSLPIKRRRGDLTIVAIRWGTNGVFGFESRFLANGGFRKSVVPARKLVTLSFV